MSDELTNSAEIDDLLNEALELLGLPEEDAVRALGLWRRAEHEYPELRDVISSLLEDDPTGALRQIQTWLNAAEDREALSWLRSGWELARRNYAKNEFQHIADLAREYKAGEDQEGLPRRGVVKRNLDGIVNMSREIVGLLGNWYERDLLLNVITKNNITPDTLARDLSILADAAQKLAANPSLEDRGGNVNAWTLTALPAREKVVVECLALFNAVGERGASATPDGAFTECVQYVWQIGTGIREAPFREPIVKCSKLGMT